MNKKAGNNPNPSGFPNLPELPPDLLEPDLRRLDARLTHELRSMPIPPGLADRVYEASAGHLAPPRLQLSPTGGESPMRLVRVRRQWWGRVAMAASLFLVVGVSWNLMNQSSTPISNEHALLVTPETPRLIPPSNPIQDLTNTYVLSVDTEQLLLELASTDPGNDMSYLALTRDITLSDIMDDFINVLSELNEEGGL
ncbi:MAG: hypothetical protein O7G85_10515 [Planctomycetota bacterium]|nr:hypothetical protein [Planctomycetota bacterium]